VSTILNALKKLETDASPEAAETATPESTPSKLAIVRGRLQTKRRVIITISGCILLGVAWVGLRLFFSPESPPVIQSQPAPDDSTPDSGSPPTNAVKERPEITQPAEPTLSRTPATTDKAAPKDRPPSAEKGNKPIPAENPPQRPTPAPGPADIQIFNDPRLQLQAIAWSEQAEDRIAVINGALVREGGQVKGVAIIQIGVDEVVFEEGGRRWKQKF
jgi:hypothetical protein